jgi:predicted site-specific integrase-resolvase
VSLFFQLAERTVCGWIRRGRLQTVRDQRGIRRYPAEVVRDLLAAATEPAGEPTI